MNTIVPRTCTEIPPPEENRNQQKDSRPLKAFRDRPAYVLLGDPGVRQDDLVQARGHSPRGILRLRAGLHYV